ncbi:hypothetical protein [Sphingobium mellinum]|uniref:hypothetical protein n=1 Tax=Sphingobium mellinum TaxID=1387166 RepID=UPI0030ED5C75
MALGEWLRGLWSGTKRYVEALAWAADYDPVEEQRRWIAGLEERVRRIEAGLPGAPTAQDRPAHRPTQT